MIPGQFDYVRPGTLDETLQILKDREGEAKLLSGGYSLLPLIKLRLAQPALLVDLRDVAGLDGIVETRRLPRASAPGRPTARSTRRRSSATATRSSTTSTGDDRRPAGPQLGHDRRLRRPRRPGLGLAGGPHRGATRTIVCRSQTGDRDDRGARLLPRHVPDGHRADRGPDRDPDPAPAARHRPAPTRSSSARSATSRRSASRPIVRLDDGGTSRAPGSALTGVAETPFAATDAEARPASATHLGRRSSARRAPRPRRRAGRPATSAVRSNTSGRWPRS